MQNFKEISSNKVLNYQDSRLKDIKWPEINNAFPSDHVWYWIHLNHFYNSSLWLEEDLARRVEVSDSEIAKNKRNIDKFNQKRNDAIEMIDTHILQIQEDIEIRHDSWQSSETLGSIIDRLSIASLKIHNMEIQSNRKDISSNVIDIAKTKKNQLIIQRQDLAYCLDQLINGMNVGKAFYKIYRQHKMYNDPTMNPYLSGLKPQK